MKKAKTRLLLQFIGYQLTAPLQGFAQGLGQALGQVLLSQGGSTIPSARFSLDTWIYTIEHCVRR